MNTTSTEQPEAQRLSLLLATGWTRQKELTQAADELDRQHAEIARLHAENKALRSAVAEEVAAELEACEERVVSLFEVLETPYLPDITRAIRARGTP